MTLKKDLITQTQSPLSEHPLRLPDDNCLENGWCDSHQVREWCPAWISFSPSGSVLYHCWDVFECLGHSKTSLEVSISFYTDKNLLQNLSLSASNIPTGEERLFSNCFSLAAVLGWLWVNPAHIKALIGDWVIQAHHLHTAM